MYRGLPYRKLSIGAVRKLVALEIPRYSDAHRIFLADGDVMLRPFDELREILLTLNESFPRLARISLYANGSSINTKTDEQLRVLRSLKLHTLYMGLESGDEQLLKRCRKGETAAEMVRASVAAQAAGLRISVMILLGLGGVDGSAEHAEATAAALNRMQPRLLSALRAIPIAGTELHCDEADGRFCQLTEWEIVRELRDIIQHLEIESTVFRANHGSNVVPLEGRLPRDKERLLLELDALLASNTLDRQSPGPMPMWL